MPRLAASGARLALLAFASCAGSVHAAADQRGAMLEEYCVRCHNEIDFKGNLSFEGLDATNLAADSRVWEAITRKLRGRMMPPRDVAQPDPHQVQDFLADVEGELDRLASTDGGRAMPAVLRRLNRTEYANAIRDVLGLEINPAGFLPADDSAGGFDNMAQGLTLSPALLEGYLAASAKVAALAVGDPTIRPQLTTYRTAPDQSQDSPVQGAPLGTMGGLVFEHYFPLDGEYEFQPKLYRGILAMVKGLEFPQALEVTIDKQRVHLAEFGGQEDNLKSRANAFATADEIDARLTFRAPVTAGPHVVSVGFLRTSPVQAAEVWQQYQRTVIDSNEDKGTPHLDKINIVGPYDPQGVGTTPSRQQIFTCHPAADASAAVQERCATEILSTVARRAWRRPVARAELGELLSFFRLGQEQGSFDEGIETAVRRVISGPEFVFRAELAPARANARGLYRVSDIELATRLSFFLWSSVPDEELLQVAGKGQLSRPKVLESQVRRMLEDPKSAALVTHFGGQWLTLRNLRGVVPDPALFPDFDNNLREAFIRETELLFNSIVQEDRNVVDLLNADYTFVNERLARHYGIPGVYGTRFRRVTVSDDARRGILGQGSFLTLTSVATRTSAVGRGKWVLANLLASEPPPPPPNVPALEQSATATPTTLREQLSAHRADPNCAACHRVMDPIGFSLENFDAVGRWRDQDHSLPIDPSDVMFDGTPITGAAGLRKFLLDNQYMYVRALTEKLMSYALGRQVDAGDMPAVRAVLRNAQAHDNRFSTLILGIVNSEPFLTRGSPAEQPTTAQTANQTANQATH